MIKRNILVAPSILSADFSKLGDEIKKVEASGADMIHIDVMDGRFVPNITIGPLVVAAVKRCTRLPLDVHLMIEEPHRFLKGFADAGSDIITIHAEAYSSEDRRQKSEVRRQRSEDRRGTSRTTDKIDEERVKKVLGEIKKLGKKAGLSLNPDSPFCIQGVLGECDMVLIMSVHPGFGGQGFIKEAMAKIKEVRKAYSGDIEVDGGINDKNCGSVIDAGANIIVAGSYFFSASDPKAAIKKLRAANT
ncbi:MAG: ribulose-phosphate 3-epimerase [Candidatus Omnitrophica bacterium]|nr:ribulose-phosphate 3-epimerase [Candidatus Omnitrophota bacterium]